MSAEYSVEEIHELVEDLMSCCRCIGYATSGNERASHISAANAAKEKLISAFPHPPAQAAQVDAVGFIEGVDDETNTVTVDWRGPISSGDALFVRNEFDFAKHLRRQRDWSGRTFGPGSRAQGVVNHIRKELREIEANPGDLEEWIDVAILALDGAWRSGAQPQEIIDALVAKQAKNEGRVWPDWRTADPTKAIEHDRSHDAPTAETAAQGRWGDESTPFNDWWDSHRAAHATNVHLKALAIAAWTASRTYHECAARPRAVPEGIRERLIRLQVGGCSCGTKTPELKYHDEGCHYRMAAEIQEMLYTTPSPGESE